MDEDIHVDQIHAWEIVTSSFNDPVTRIDNSHQPVIYADNSATGLELAWVFKIRVHSKLQVERTILIGAATGFILINSKLIVH